MLTKTSINAIQALMYIAQRPGEAPVSPLEIAKRLGASPTYLGKIHTLLAKADLLKTHRGARGGVTLGRSPAEITLLDIAEACQGKVLGDYCAPHDNLSEVCAFHEAMYRLQEAILSVLSGWTLEMLLARPGPAKRLMGKVNCFMLCTLPEKRRR